MERPVYIAMDDVKKVLTYEEDDDDDVIMIQDDEEDNSMEEGEIIAVVQPSQRRRDIIDQLPVAPVLMAVKALSSRIHILVVEGCEGCREDQPGQEAHQECLYMEWQEKVEKYFVGTVNRLNEKTF